MQFFFFGGGRVGRVFRADGGVFKLWKRGSVSEKDSKKLAEGLWGAEWVCDNVGEGN